MIVGGCSCSTSNGVVDGSHLIEEKDGKVVIKRLELFAGFDPTIDDGSDEEIRKFNRSKVRKIVERTKAFIARRQHPKLVVLHGQEDHSEPKEAVGSVIDIELEDRNGVPFIVGDVEMSREDFDSYIASNKFARRSAEIWSDDHMSEIALLGRDTPRRPLPDTRFAKQGDKIVFSMHASRFEAAPGAGNVFVPGAAIRKKESSMDEAKDPKSDGKEEMAKMMAEMKADIEKLKEEHRKSYNACGKTENEKDEDEDEDEDDDVHVDIDSHNEGKKKKSVNAKIEFSREKTKFEKRIAALEGALAKERFSRDLDSMESEGYAIAASRDEMLEELVSSGDPARKIQFWRDNFRRDPIGVRVDVRPASGLKRSVDSVDRETVAKFVAEAAGDPEKFKTLMARAKSGA
jgi:hypothetical protein